MGLYRTFAAAFLVHLAFGATSGSPRQAPPALMLWAWYAPADLRPVTDPKVGIAYFALQLSFEGQGDVTPSPRMTPIRLAPAAYRMMVVRFDYWSESPPAFSPRQRDLAVRMVAEMAGLAKPQAVQIDFDAPRSAWPFYRQLLADLRSRLGANIYLSITALVSWCDTAQSWMAGLNVDEIVPMAFSMGQATPAIAAMLRSGGQFAFAGCRASLGVELGNELAIRPRRNQRAYFFSHSEWSPAMVAQARQAVLP